MKRTIRIATGNPGKVKEITSILSGLDLEFKSILDSDCAIPVQETGSTYIENARLKAVAYQTISGQLTLADDSGLEVDALQGEPGIHSARYSPKDNATDSDHRHYLLQRLARKPKPWTARFHCSVVLAVSPEKRFITEGQCEGIIIPQEQGTGGFGYDPIFYLPAYQATMAEIPSILKNKISHRAKALQALIPILEQLFSMNG